MKKDQVNQILEYTKNQLIQLEDNIDKVLLKNTLENLRSILDYIAKDVSDIFNPPEKKVYFPYGRRLNHFKRSIRKNFPGIEKKCFSIVASTILTLLS